MTDAADRIAALPKRSNPRHVLGPVRAYLVARKKLYLRLFGRPGDGAEIDWDAAAKVIEAELDAQGTPQTLTGDHLRKTWWRICNPSGVSKRKARLRDRPKQSKPA